MPPRLSPDLDTNVLQSDGQVSSGPGATARAGPNDDAMTPAAPS